MVGGGEGINSSKKGSAVTRVGADSGKETRLEKHGVRGREPASTCSECT